MKMSLEKITLSIGKPCTETTVTYSDDGLKVSQLFSSSSFWATTTFRGNTLQPLSAVTEKNVTVSSAVNSAQMFQIFAIIIGLAAVVTNGFVLYVMIYYKQVTKKTTNLFIFNQSILDLIASVGLALATLLRVIGISSRVYANSTSKWLLCLIFESGVLVNFPIFASQASLVVITIERYYKIVHPISHRINFRPWMIKSGIILPWIMGAIFYLVPAWSSTRIINGLCTPFDFSNTQLFVAYSVISFAYLFALPSVIFVFGYGKIIGVIRHQNQVVSSHNTAALELPASSTAAGSGDDSEGNGQRGSQVNQSQKKIVKTVLMITVIFSICWLPTTVYQTGVNLKLLQNQASITFGLAALAYLNVLLNPLIYAAHFDVIKKVYNGIVGLF